LVVAAAEFACTIAPSATPCATLEHGTPQHRMITAAMGRVRMDAS
jgi:hypothetical protein